MRRPASRGLPTALHSTPQPLFVFDGVCVLCSRAVKFILKREWDTALLFTPAQSPLGQEIFAAFDLPTNIYETLVVLESGRAYVKSAAVLQLAKRLRQPWRGLGTVAGLMPGVLVDWLYDRVAHNRYRMFGRYDTCMVPDAALRARFVETAGSNQSAGE